MGFDSSELLLEGIFSLGVNMGFDSIPLKKLVRIRVQTEV